MVKSQIHPLPLLRRFQPCGRALHFTSSSTLPGFTFPPHCRLRHTWTPFPLSSLFAPGPFYFARSASAFAPPFGRPPPLNEFFFFFFFESSRDSLSNPPSYSFSLFLRVAPLTAFFSLPPTWLRLHKAFLFESMTRSRLSVRRPLFVYGLIRRPVASAVIVQRPSLRFFSYPIMYHFLTSLERYCAPPSTVLSRRLPFPGVSGGPRASRRESLHLLAVLARDHSSSTLPSISFFHTGASSLPSSRRRDLRCGSSWT